MIKVAFDIESSVVGVIRHTFGTFMHHLNIEWTESIDAELVVGHSDEAHIFVSRRFVDLVVSANFDHHAWFEQAPILIEESKEDFLGTCAYMLNGWQELQAKSDDYDHYQRFKYTSSWQNRFNCIDEPLVQNYFDRLASSVPALASNRRSRASRLFISHDMDRISRAFISEGKWALSRIKPFDILSLTWDKVSGQSSWANMGEIMDLVEGHGFRSTFFWLVEQGTGLQGIENADYSFQKTIVEPGWLEQIEARGFNNGLHKAATDLSFGREKSRFPNPSNITSNRNHYLRINLSKHYEQLEEGGILFDSSVGFAEHAGYRLGYGNAFVPYNIREDRPYRLVEAPLLLMDVTLCQNMFKDLDKAVEYAENFLSNNSENHIHTLLWHNNYISDRRYAGWKNAFERILTRAKELQIESCHPDELVAELLGDKGE